MIRQALTYDLAKKVAENRAENLTLGISDILPYIEAYVIPNCSLAVMDGDEPVAAFGIVPLWRGVGEAWMIPAKSHLRKPVALGRHVKMGILEIAEGLQLHRLQAAVKADFEMGRRLVELIGFDRESLMPQYGPDGDDYERFALLWRS